MVLNNRNLGELIARCLFGKQQLEEYRKFVIPRKGNFLNPQYLTDVDTYAIFHITNKVKKLTNMAMEGDEDIAHHATLKSDIDIQFIGLHAEEWANSTLFWDERADVQDAFAEYNAQLLLGDLYSRAIVTVPFQQDGYNGELSYLVSLGVIQNVSLREVKEYWTSPIIMLGSLIVEK